MNRAVTRAYDQRSAQYVEALGSVDQMTVQDRVTITTWRDRVAGPVLDLGCGPGHWTDLLAKGGDARAVGVDGSAAMVASARVRFPGECFVRADLADLPFADGSVGAVLAWYSVIHTEPRTMARVLGEISRVLRPGGSVVLGFFDGPAGSPFGHSVTTAYWWSAQALSELMAPHGLLVVDSSSRQDAGVRRHGQLEATLRPTR